jgi:ABC-2 type transport system ATP-binding protein
VMGLIHDPKLIFMDEPTTGLDPQARANLWEHIRQLRRRGSTIFLTTHYLDEADALCDRIMVIDHGRIVASGEPEALKQQVSGDAVRLTLTEAARADVVRKITSSLPGATDSEIDGDVVTFRVPQGGSVLPGLLRSIDAEGVELAGVEVHRPTLDDVFLTMTGRSLRDESPETSEEKIA